MQYLMTRCYFRKPHPVGEATGEEDTSALSSILTRGGGYYEVTRPATTDTLAELALYLV